MPKRARGAILAVGGALALLAAAQNQAHAHNHGQRAPGQPPPPITPVVAKPQGRYIASYSCDPPQSAEQDNLCQERRSAQAAEKSVEWARYTFWAGVAGTVGLVATLIFTARATQAAQRSARAAEIAVERGDAALAHAKEVSRIELRPYLSFMNLDSGTAINSSFGSETGDWVVAVPVFKNFGKTPARNAIIHVAQKTVPFASYVEFERPPLKQEAGTNVMPGVQTNGPYIPVIKAQAMRLFRREISCYVMITASYGENSSDEVFTETFFISVLINKNPQEWLLPGPPQRHDGAVTFMGAGDRARVVDA